jgi:hypothetical protein
MYLSFALTGVGEVWLDDVTVRPMRSGSYAPQNETRANNWQNSITSTMSNPTAASSATPNLTLQLPFATQNGTLPKPPKSPQLQILPSQNGIQPENPK